MNPSEHDSYSEYRMEKAEESYQAAELLVANGQWNAAMNRLYYAAYFAISGLLAKSGIETKTHAGVKTQFLLHYVKTGAIDIKMGKLYGDLFDWRLKGDYGDFFDFNEEDVLPLVKPVRTLIDAVIQVNKGL